MGGGASAGPDAVSSPGPLAPPPLPEAEESRGLGATGGRFPFTASNPSTAPGQQRASGLGDGSGEECRRTDTCPGPRPASAYVGAGADGARTAVAAAVGAAAIVRPTAVHYSISIPAAVEPPETWDQGWGDAPSWHGPPAPGCCQSPGKQARAQGPGP